MSKRRILPYVDDLRDCPTFKLDTSYISRMLAETPANTVQLPPNSIVIVREDTIEIYESNDDYLEALFDHVLCDDDPVASYNRVKD